MFRSRRSLSSEAPLLDGQTIPGIDGPVYALTGFGELLIAGGLFTAAGDVSASNIAAWDGSAWEPLGSGTNGVVRALITGGTRAIVRCFIVSRCLWGRAGGGAAGCPG